jgi:hypothetical protein
MLNPCCDEMRCRGRDHYKGVPESDLPDALIELHPAEEAAMLLTPTGRFDCFIQFCPWCGKRIGKDAQELVRSGFNPFD